MKLSEMSSFVSFDLNPEEELAAYTFTEVQRAGLQNTLSAAAEELLLIRLDERLGSEEERIKAAYTRGQIDTCKFLLERSLVLEEELAAARAQQAQQAPQFNQFNQNSQEGN